MVNKLEFKGVKSVIEHGEGFESYGASYNALRMLNPFTEKETFVVLHLDNKEYVKPKDSSGKPDPSGKDTFDCTFGFASSKYSPLEEEIFKIKNLKVKSIERGDSEFIDDYGGSTSPFIVVIDSEQDLKDIKVEFLNTDYLSSLMNNQSYISDLLA